MKLLNLLIIALLFSTLANGQGEYLDRGKSGLEIGASFLTTEHATGYGGNVRYSISGIFDFGIDIERYSPNSNNLTQTVISPSVTYFVLKQNDELPLSFSINSGYEWEVYPNNTNNYIIGSYNNSVLSGNYFFFGGTVLKNYRISETFGIQPYIGITYVGGKYKVENGFNNRMAENFRTTVLTLGFGLQINTSQKNMIVITPLLGRHIGTTNLGVNLTYIICAE